MLYQRQLLADLGSIRMGQGKVAGIGYREIEDGGRISTGGLEKGIEARVCTQYFLNKARKSLCISGRRRTFGFWGQQGLLNLFINLLGNQVSFFRGFTN